MLENIADLHISHGEFNLAETELLNLLQRYKAINDPKISLNISYIELLHSQNKLQRINAEQATRTKNITLTCATLLLIIIGLLFNRYLVKQRNNRKLEANQKELDQKNIFLPCNKSYQLATSINKN